MANPSKASTATAADVDWSFTNDPDASEACELAAGRATASFPGFIDFDDALHDVYLWLAPRPDVPGKYLNGDGSLNVKGLAYHLYSNGLRPRLVAQSNRHAEMPEGVE